MYPTKTFGWRRDRDEFYLDVLNIGQLTRDFSLRANQCTHAGEIVSREDDKKMFESSRTENGAGHWTEYQDDGSVSAAGDWDVDG